MNSDLRERIEAGLPHDRPFALAFSGGTDSLALLTLLCAHPRLNGVLHVDHGLREGSDAEAERAAEMAKQMGVKATTLRWAPGRLSSRIQEKARQARYGLMGDWCRAHRVDDLVTAHHADDQAETVLMRVQRGSGWRGAAGMAVQTYGPVWPELAGVTLVRPALSIDRIELHSLLSADQKPIQDVSNDDHRYARVRVRQELRDDLSLRQDMLGLSRDMEAGLATDRLRLAHDLRGHHVTHEGQFSVPRLLGVSALCRLAPIIGGQSGPLSPLGMEDKQAQIERGETIAVGGGAMAQWDGEILTLSRDPVAISGRRDRNLMPTAFPIVIGPQPTVWDGRFIVEGRAGQLHPERRGVHVGFRVLYGQSVRIRNLVKERLAALLP